MTGVTEFAAEPPNELEPRFAKAHGATLIRCDRADYVPVSPQHFDHATAWLPFGIGTFRIDELDDQLVRFGPRSGRRDCGEDCVLDRGRFVEVTSNTF